MKMRAIYDHFIHAYDNFINTIRCHVYKRNFSTNDPWVFKKHSFQEQANRLEKYFYCSLFLLPRPVRLAYQSQ